MLSSLIQTFEDGLRVMSSNSRLLLIGVLVFVFPLIFIWVTQLFYSTAYDNIHYSEKLRIGMLHDTISALVPAQSTDEAMLKTTIREIVGENSDISKLALYKETPKGLLILAAIDDSTVGQIDPTAEPIRDLGFSNKLDFMLTEFIIDGNRVWQAYRRIEVANTFYYVFSEHSMAQFDDTMSYRRQQSYYGLTIVFVFLAVLAFWLHRQTHWQKEYYQLADTLHERDLFSNMIAHEFRSPLTAIKGYASFLEESQALPPEERRFAGNIRQSANHLVELVSDFLEVARIQSGKLKIEKRELDVRSVIKTAVENLTGMATEKGLKLVFDDKGEPLILETDQTRLLQVLTNVISNAVKYTNSGTVTIAYSEEYKKVVLRIMDTGMGISAEDQKKLFSPFTRVGGVDGSKITGTGLGMYITKQLITLLGGEVGVESIKGVGSHVVISFITK